MESRAANVAASVGVGASAGAGAGAGAGWPGLDQAQLYRQRLQVRLDSNLRPLRLPAHTAALLQRLERRSGVPKLYIAVAVVGTVVSLVLANIFATLLTNVVGFVYPAYASFKAIETADKEDDKHWLTYWVVFSFLTILEYFSSWILELFPFYYFIKLAFLVYLFHDATRGAELLYNRVIRPFLLQNQSLIDRSVSRVTEEASSFTERAKDVGARVTSAVLVDKIHGQ